MTKTRHLIPAIGSPAFTRELVDGFKDAVQKAIAQHHANGHAVYIADEEGHICELRPGSPPRKLSQAELEEPIGKT